MAAILLRKPPLRHSNRSPLVERELRRRGPYVPPSNHVTVARPASWKLQILYRLQGFINSVYCKL